MDCPKTKMNTQILRQLTLAKMAEFCSRKKIFTNRSVSNDGRPSIGIFSEWNGSSIGIRVSDGSSIFHVECLAVQKALDAMLEAESGSFVIFCDSKSVLSDLKKRQGNVIPIIVHLQKKI